MRAAGEICVDALNVAYWCGAPPSLRFPLALLTGLNDRGFAAALVFDASAPHQFGHEIEVFWLLRELSGPVLMAPSGVPADRVLLRRATSTGGRIISRDRFRDHRRRHRKLIDDPVRCLSGQVANQVLTVEALGIEVPIQVSASAAFGLLAESLQSSVPGRPKDGHFEPT